MNLQLIVKKPGNLLGVFLRTEITEQQYADIVLLLSKPDKYQVAPKPPIGFRPPSDELDKMVDEGVRVMTAAGMKADRSAIREAMAKRLSQLK